LSDLGLERGSGPSEVVKVTVEPVVDLSVDLVVLVTDLLRGKAFFLGFGLGGGPVLVGSAHVDRVVASQPAEPTVDISGENTSDKVSEMRHIVDVRKGGGDEDVPLSLDRYFLGVRVQSNYLSVRLSSSYSLGDLILRSLGLLPEVFKAEESIFLLNRGQISVKLFVSMLDRGEVSIDQSMEEVEGLALELGDQLGLDLGDNGFKRLDRGFEKVELGGGEFEIFVKNIGPVVEPDTGAESRHLGLVGAVDLGVVEAN
jgi:hypothetical protein